VITKLRENVPHSTSCGNLKIHPVFDFVEKKRIHGTFSGGEKRDQSLEEDQTSAGLFEWKERKEGILDHFNDTREKLKGDVPTIWEYH